MHFVLYVGIQATASIVMTVTRVKTVLAAYDFAINPTAF